MANNKRLLPAVAVAVFAFPAISFAAFDVGTFRADLDASLSRLIAKYEARIAELEAEIESLKARGPGHRWRWWRGGGTRG